MSRASTDSLRNSSHTSCSFSLVRGSSLVVYAASLLLVFVVGCDTTSPEQQQEEERTVELTSQEVTRDDAQAAREYWTAERMLDAEPYPIGVDGDPPAPTEPETPEPDVEVQEREGTLPEDAQLNDKLRDELEDAISSPKGSSPSSAVEITQSYTNYPYRAMGRVFFLKDGSGRACSAAVIASKNRSVVWTAGHCVAEQGNEDWHERWVFVPAYESGEAPLGRWAARVKTTFVGWYAGGNRNYDLGAVVVEQRDQRSIAGVTGSLGWMFNAQRSQDWQEFGYPGSGNLFSGQKLWTCSEPYAGGDGVGSNPGPRTSTMKCDYTAGASGGPWVVNFENCPGCYINSVNSWWWWNRNHSHLALQWAGPYHGTAAYKLLQFAEKF